MIYIDDNTRINATEHEFKLEKQVKSKKGSKSWSILGHYSSMEAAFNALIRKKVRMYVSRKNKDTLEDLLHEMKIINDIVSAIYMESLGYPKLEELVIGYSETIVKTLVNERIDEITADKCKCGEG